MKKKVLIINNLAPIYRKGIWDKLLFSKSFQFYFLFGHNFKLNIHNIDFSSEKYNGYSRRLIQLKNYWVLKKILIWQSGVIFKCFNNNLYAVIFLGEMYCISTWISAIICRIRGIGVVFWGHGIYGNENKVKLYFRVLFYKLANKHLIYENRSKELMKKQGFKSEDIFLIYNSLDYDAILKNRKIVELKKTSKYLSFKNSEKVKNIIFIGRITLEKKLDLLIQSISELNSITYKYNLLIIGTGLHEIILKEKFNFCVKEGWLKFWGSCYDESILSDLIYFSDLCISPGNVGLTAIHSFSYGTPVATHSNILNQGPEFESIIDGFNGFLFEENNVKDLKLKLSKWFDSNHDRNSIRKQCMYMIDKHYNPNYQFSVISELLDDLYRKNN